MRNISPLIKSILVSGNIMGFHLVKIESPRITLLHTDLPVDVDVPGVGLYLCDSGLVSVEAPRLSSIIDRESYKITYADTSSYFRELFESNIVGAKVVVHTGLINNTENTIGGIAPGGIFINDLVIAYQGIVDTPAYTVNAESGTVTAMIECSSPMANLGMSRPRYTNKESLNRVNPADKAFDSVFIGSKAVTLLWGKEKEKE